MEKENLKEAFTVTVNADLEPLKRELSEVETTIDRITEKVQQLKVSVDKIRGEEDKNIQAKF